MKRIFTIFTLMLVASFVFAQGSVKGILLDGDTNEPLIGASIMVDGTTIGTITDYNGAFMLSNIAEGSKTLVASYLGYTTTKIPVSINSGTTDIGNVIIKAGGVGLDLITVNGTMDIVQDRRTPVAVSTISAAEIQAKSAGNVELTEIAKATPSVYVANQSGGYGDSEVFTRGFDQTNTAFLLNGQPINGMEDGKMYWSNWSGLTDVASAIQVQRGLGASKLAISSVGGTWNFIMKATDTQKGGGASLTVGNSNYQKLTAFYNTGMINDKWGVSVLLSNWSGNGWADGTKGQGQTYFISAGFKPNERHTINFLLTGAPQYHDQNFNKSISSYYSSDGELNPKYNGNWGLYKGQYFTERRNFYHKPVANINWDFQINDKSKFSTVLYASWGRGGGTGGLGKGRVRTTSGLIDFDAIVAAKDTNDAVTYIRRASMNQHSWYGAVLNYELDFTPNLKFSVGSDVRSYTGDHFREVSDLIGSKFYKQRGSTRYPNGIEAGTAYPSHPWGTLSDYAEEGDRIAYNSGETINYGGVFTQLEYSNDYLSAYVQGAVSNQTHVRFEKYYASVEDEKSDKVSNLGYNLKGGLSYNLNENSNVFINSGIYSRQPFHDNVYIGNSNNISPATENEEIFGLELGYKLSGDKFGANVNVYRTAWNNRISSQFFRDGEVATINGVDHPIVGEGYINTKQNQLHQGVELDFSYFLTEAFTLKGFGSVGDWVKNGDAHAQLFDDNQNLVDEETFTGESSVDGQKIGGSAQTSAGLGVKYDFSKNFYTELNYIYYANLYARVSSGELQLPDFGVMDLNIGYKIPMDNGSILRIGTNVYNLLNTLYISQANSAIEEGVDENGNIDEKLNWNHINLKNRVRFGKTRTWNVSMKYQF